MSSPQPNPDLRRAELLAEQALSELTAEQSAELAALDGAAHDEAEIAAYEHALAAMQEALCAERLQEPEAALTERLLADAEDFFAQPSAAPVLPFEAPKSTGVAQAPASRAPWLLTAAALLLAIAGWWPQAGQAEPTEIGPAADFNALLAQAPADLLRLDWQVLADSSVGENSAGEIVWSDSAQEGYMRFEGLAVNDPQVEQYQLWIFDREQDVAYPVDGGVFDIGSDGEVIVPIRAKIEVAEAFQFAITVEKPGGVVVSSRERLPLLAAVSG